MKLSFFINKNKNTISYILNKKKDKKKIKFKIIIIFNFIITNKIEYMIKKMIILNFFYIIFYILKIKTKNKYFISFIFYNYNKKLKLIIYLNKK